MEFLGDCIWCGKKLCEYCIARQEGRKYYCENCAIRLVPFKRERLPQPAKQQKTTEQIPVPEAKPRFMLDNEGYFELQ
jgi:hypothetical protein